MSFTNMAGLPLSNRYAAVGTVAGGLTKRRASVIYPFMEQQFQEPAEAVARSSGITAIDRGAELLVRVLESEEPVALADLASASGIPKSTASRLVSALERQGLVEQDGERGRLRPGPAILRVAERSMLERSILELARRSLDVLSAKTGETINLAVPGPSGVEHIAQVESAHFLGAGQWLGRSAEYHTTANGKVFMAFDRAPIPARPPAVTEHTITDPTRLTAELARIRRDDFAESINELEIGLAAIASPVRGAGGQVVAALSITGPTVRMTPERIDEIKPILIEEAGILSRRLGNTEQGEHAA
jgi:IclR family acetate operon transcriptional repressor